jgi:hypothetical protein
MLRFMQGCGPACHVGLQSGQQLADDTRYQGLLVQVRAIRTIRSFLLWKDVTGLFLLGLG